MKIRFLLYFIVSVFLFSGVSFSEASVLTDAQADRSKLEAELANLEREIAQKQRELDGQKGQSATLSNDIRKLTTQISKAKTEIQSKNLLIKKLGGEITQKDRQIQTLTQKIESEKQTLAQLVRKSREIGDKSLISFILSKQKISEAYGDIDNFVSLKDSIGESLGIISEARSETEFEKKTLQQQREKQVDVRAELENTKKQVERNEKDKKQLLTISKNKEAEYAKVLQARQAEASRIRARLFELAGGVQGGGIPFGDAVKFAEYAADKTGVRAAFILGILKQESNIGSNVGTCYLADDKSGASVGITSGRTFKNGIHPTRDIPPFLRITSALGLDPFKTRISCPIANVPGFGGAMGPSQFIPSTWVMFADKIADYYGVRVANPWNPQHAIMATALLLKDNGAARGGQTAEMNAACRYYSGRPCDAPGVKNAFYGRGVIDHAKKMQEEIDFIKAN
jgi:membrane-bound lytic murein transglycosylase B